MDEKLKGKNVILANLGLFRDFLAHMDAVSVPKNLTMKFHVTIYVNLKSALQKTTINDILDKHQKSPQKGCF